MRAFSCHNQLASACSNEVQMPRHSPQGRDKKAHNDSKKAQKQNNKQSNKQQPEMFQIMTSCLCFPKQGSLPQPV